MVAYQARASQWRKIGEIGIAALNYFKAATSNHPPGRRASKRERELFKALKAAGVTKEEAINGSSF